MSKKNKNGKNTGSATIKNESQPLNTISATPKDNSTIWFYGAIAFLVIITFIAFWGGFDNQFVDWDDSTYITDNPLIQNTKDSWGKVWHSHVASNYHPLTMITLMINASIWGIESARSFIVMNTIIHLLNVLLVFWFIILLLKKQEEEKMPKTGKALFIAFFTALVFAIHPLKVESVTWVSERKDVLYGFFFIAGCISYLKYLGSNMKIKYLAYAFVLFILSCLSKGQAVVLPIVFLLLDYWYNRKFEARTIIEKLPFLAISLLFGVIASKIQAGQGFYGLIDDVGKLNATALSEGGNYVDRLKASTYGFSQYWIRFLFPHNLSCLYPYLKGDGKQSYNYGFGFIFTLIIIGVTAFSFKRYKTLFFGIVFFGITFILVSQIISVGGAVMADRYTYIPYIGLAFILFYSISTIIEKKSFNRNLSLGVITLFVIFFLIKTRNQVDVWQNTRTLMTQRSDLYPADDRAHYLIAKYTGEKENNYDLCISEYLKCLETVDTTKKLDIWANVGAAFAKKKEHPKAIEYLNIAIRKDPMNGIHYKARGYEYLEIQQPEKALPDLERAISLPIRQEDRPNLYGALATAQLNVGKIKESLNNYNIAINKEGSKNAIHFLNRGIAVYKLTQDRSKAIQDIKKSLEIDPMNAGAQNALKALEGT